MKETKSPIEGDAGKVKVITPPLVLQKYPLPAVATVVPVVITACHEAPPVTSPQDKTPAVEDFKT